MSERRKHLLQFKQDIRKQQEERYRKEREQRENELHQRKEREKQEINML